MSKNMENKHSNKNDEYQNMRDFNPRFHDLYEDYSDQQQNAHTYNLNGIIYAHNHKGGEPIKVGRAKSPLDGADGSSMERAMPDRQPRTERAIPNRQPRAEQTIPNRQPRVEQTIPNRQPRVEQAIPNRPQRRGGYRQSAVRENNSIPRRKATAIFSLFLVCLFLIAMLAGIFVPLLNGDDVGEQREEEYAGDEIEERDSDPLEEPIAEEGKVWLFGGYIQLGAPAQTLWENFNETGLTQSVEPDGQYTMSLDFDDMYGVGYVVLYNDSENQVNNINQLKIDSVHADYYWDNSEEVSRRVETDCEIIGGITIGMDGEEARAALEKLCGEVNGTEGVVEDEEGERCWLVGSTNAYNYSITLMNGRVRGIDVYRIR